MNLRAIVPSAAHSEDYVLDDRQVRLPPLSAPCVRVTNVELVSQIQTGGTGNALL